MTSFAFIAGLIPLVVATGAGAIGNRTIGTTGAGGMLVGTVIGVLVIPGLYYLFGRIDDGRSLTRDDSLEPIEVDEPLSEIFEHPDHGSHRDHERHQICVRDHSVHRAGPAVPGASPSRSSGLDPTC